METFRINERCIGRGFPTYVIAEISSNHNQDFQVAADLVKVAKEAGADAVKLQTYTADTLTISSAAEIFRIKGGTLWDGYTYHDLYSKTYMPWDWQPELKRLADRLGIDLFSTAYDRTAVEFLEKMDVPAYKISSFEIVDLPLVECVASTGKPVLISTGMATAEEIREALNTARAAGNKQIALLKCVSAYPAPPEAMNLNTIPAMIETFGVPVGLSDHSLNTPVPSSAVALGACIVEKHLTLSREIPTPDCAFSLEPAEFKEMVEDIRLVERALGSVRYGYTPEEESSRLFRRSLFVVEDINEGESFTEKNVRSIRPGYGMHTRHLKEVLGRRARRDIRRGSPLSWDLVD